LFGAANIWNNLNIPFVTQDVNPDWNNLVDSTGAATGADFSVIGIVAGVSGELLRGQFYRLPPCENELRLTFGTHLALRKRSDRGSALRLGNTERFLGSSAEVDRIQQPEGESDKSGGHRRLVQGSTVWLPSDRAEICDRL
jgi:hypothetical protein